MYNAFLERTREAISALGKHIRTSDRFRTAVFDETLRCVSGTPCFDPALASTETVPDRIEWRIIDHCAAVTRIYAIYEQFVHEMIREHIGLLQGRLPFADLPDSIRSSYRSGVARILDKKEGPRYADVDLGQLIAAYNCALAGERVYTLEPRAMLMQEQNLRLPELHRLLCACGVDGMEHWVEKHRSLRAFFAEEDRLTASAASEMAELIKYRNDAAHGSIDISNILHVNVLIEFCDFVSAVCEALAERVQLAGLMLLVPHAQVSERGKVTECLKEGMVVIGEVTGTFKVGSPVYLRGEDYCVERSVVSFQVQGRPHAEVNFDTPTELGIMLDAPGRKNAALLTLEPLPAIGSEEVAGTFNEISQEVVGRARS